MIFHNDDILDSFLFALTPRNAFRFILRARALNVRCRKWAHNTARWERLYQKIVPAWLRALRFTFSTLKSVMDFCRFALTVRDVVTPSKWIRWINESTGAMPLGDFRIYGPFRAPDILTDPVFVLQISLQHQLTGARYTMSRVFSIRAIGHQWGVQLLLHNGASNSPLVLPKHRASGSRVHVMHTVIKSPDDLRRYLALPTLTRGRAYANMREFIKTLRSGLETFKYDFCDNRCVDLAAEATWHIRVHRVPPLM